MKNKEITVVNENIRPSLRVNGHGARGRAKLLWDPGGRTGQPFNGRPSFYTTEQCARG